MGVETVAIKSYIEKNYKNISGPEDIAQKLGISYETMRKTFTRSERISPAAYITLYRILVCKNELMHTIKTCQEICYDAGFRREDSAQKTFKRITGMSMLEYRKNSAMKNMM